MNAETESSFPAELLRAVLVATFGSLLLNLNTTSINVALDRLMASFGLFAGLVLARSAVPATAGARR